MEERTRRRGRAVPEKSNKKKRRKKIINTLACAVAFCTTYALILPAITLENKAYCGHEEHTTHSVDAGCYRAVETMTCGLNEHTHGNGCYTTTSNLACSLEEDELHTHTEACYTESRTLTCSLKEHTHGDACYNVEQVLECDKDIHTHTDICFSNPKADLESREDWEKTLEDVELTGNWAEDVLSIANSQMGYRESTANYVVDGDGSHRGYSRYGEWYGDPYGHWCAMFVSFCLNYAEVDRELMPVEANCNRWIEALSDEEVDRYFPAEDYTPVPGDLIFFDWDADENTPATSSHHVGLVTEVILDEEDGTPIQIKTVEGNSSNKVKENTYDITNPQIMGYGQLPENPNPPEDEEENPGEEIREGIQEIKDLNDLTDLLREDNVSSGEFGEDLTQDPADTEEPTETPEEGTEQQPEAGPWEGTVEGDGYTVTLTCGPEAGIPADAYLSVTEYDKKDDGYQARYQEMLELLGFEGDGFSRYYRVFDMELRLQGEVIQPAAPVTVTIVFKDVENEEPNECALLHFGEEPELLDASVEVLDGNEVIRFETESFSDYGLLRMSEEEAMQALEDLNSDVSLMANVTFKRDRPALNGNTAVSGLQTDNLVAGEWYIIYAYENGQGYPLVSEQSAFSYRGKYNGNGQTTTVYTEAQGDSATKNYGTRQTTKLKAVSTNGGTVTYQGTQDVYWYYDGKNFVNINGDYLASCIIAVNDWNGYPYWQTHIYLDPNADDSWLFLEYNPTYRTLSHTFTYTYTSGWRSYQNTTTSKVWFQPTGWQNSTQVRGVAEAAEGPLNQDALPVYVARMTGFDDSGGSTGHDNHPRTSTTQTVIETDIMFYNFDASNGADSVTGLAGVEYTIWDDKGNVVKRLLTTNSTVVNIGSLPAGNYKIAQTGVPSGYVVVAQEKTFAVQANSSTTIGKFLDYTSGGYVAEKVGYVTDYTTRKYQVDMIAYQSLYDYTVNNIKLILVVDQSNSMLFPAELYDTGKKVTLYQSDGTKNENNLKAANLDKNQLYYIIADEENTSTVYAVFWDGSGWCYQDASSYAKAQNYVDKKTNNVKEGDYAMVPFARSDGGFNSGVNAPVNYTKCSPAGGGFGYTLGSTLGKEAGSGRAYKIYTGSTQNRLTELQKAVAMMANMLASTGSNATIELETFNKVVSGCKEYNLTQPGDLAKIISAINNIECTGGTRQDRALRHVFGGSMGEGTDTTGHKTDHTKGTNDYVILITDGAPVKGSNDHMQDYYNNSWQDLKGTEDVMKNVREQATTVRGKVDALATVALSMGNVQGGRQLLQDCATSGWFYSVDQVGGLEQACAEMLFKAMTKTNMQSYVTSYDYISDSFYPIDNDGNALEKGKTSYIDLQGNIINNPSTDGKYGIIQYIETDEEGIERNAWRVTWPSQSVAYGKNWKGSIKLKAKEDFVGGNTIDTNKTFYAGEKVDEEGAKVTLKTAANAQTNLTATELPTPTVNVRLLPINSVSSEETVFLSDEVSVKEKVQALMEGIQFTKLKDSTTDVDNKTAPADTEGLENGTFSLAYAMGDLTAAQWEDLLDGKSVEVEYTYDNPSSHGAVGKFVLTLTKSGDTSDFDDHEATDTGLAVETYTLKVDYTAYTIRSGARPADVHNSVTINRTNYGGQPGTEVGTGSTLENGKGTLASTNVHTVHVVDGKITVKKEITNSLKSDSDQTFTFQLAELTEGGTYETLLDANDQPVSLTVTVEANETTGTATLENVPRGTFKLVEVVGTGAEYHVQSMTYLADESNCLQVATTEDTEVCFTIGTDADGTDVIWANTGTGYQAVYSTLRGSTPTSDVACVGVSFEAAKVINDRTIHPAVLTVNKVWHQVDNTDGLTAYAALYKYDADTQAFMPVMDEQNRLLAVKLDKGGKWTASFTVDPPPEGTAITDYYAIRELDGVETSSTDTATNPALVTNDSTILGGEKVVYYVEAKEEGAIHIDNVGYEATIQGTDTSTASDPSATYTVTNASTYALPETGGVGTTLFTVGGALLMGASLLYGFGMRRTRERRYH